MNNYRVQNSCVNCKHVRLRFNDSAPDDYFCGIVVDAIGGRLPKAQVVENGICDTYEKRLPVVRSEQKEQGEIQF